MSRFFLRAVGALALLVLAAPAFAQSVQGCWATIDDEDNQVKSYVKIYAQGNQLVGDIVKLIPNGGRCTDCADQYNNRILRNERIMSGFTRDGDQWTGGTIVDPKSGRRYNAVMNLTEGNSDRLYLRGYIGRIRALGRTQYWRRSPASNCA